MSKLTELDKEFDEKFVEGMSYIANANKLGTKEAVKSFARKYYELGRLEEREALKKMVESLPQGEGIPGVLDLLDNTKY